MAGEAASHFSAEELAELQPVLYAHAVRAVGNRDTARDLVQETMLAAIAGQDRFEGRARLRTWAIGILSHKVLDLFRARARARLVSADELSIEDLAEPTSDHRPDRVLARREAMSILDASLRELPELERLAILLIDVEGFDRDDACARLEINANHLRVLLHRGRHRLRRALEKAGAV